LEEEMAFLNKFEEELFNKGLWKSISESIVKGLIRRYATMTEFLTDGISENPGPVLIDGTLWDNDGNVLKNPSIHSTSPLVILFGDSIIAGGNGLITAGVGATKASVSATSATFTGTSHALAVGNRFYFTGSDDPNGWGLFTVATVTDSNTFTATVPANFPISVPTTGQTKCIINISRLNDRNYVANAINEIGCVDYEILNYGAPGMRADQILPVFKRELIRNTPKIAYLGFGTNDVLQNRSESLIKADIASAIKIGANICDKFIIATIPPIGQSAQSYQASMQPLVCRLNNYIRMEANKYTNVGVLDIFGDWVQTTTHDFITAFSFDDVHPNGQAALKTVYNTKQLLLSVISPSNYRASLLSDRVQTDALSKQLNGNCIMNGTGGIISPGSAFVGNGQVPDTYTLTSSGTFTTATTSVVPRIDDRGNNIILDVSGASSGASIDFLSSSAHAFVTADDEIRGFFDISVNNSSLISSINVYVEVIVSGSTYLVTTPLYATLAPYTISGTIARYLATNKFKIPSGTISTVRQRVQVNFQAGGSINLSVGCLTLEKI
jgi:hypothetical protein